MKKILNEWRRFITEANYDPEKIRIEIGKKMNQFLFGAGRLYPSHDPAEYGNYGPDLLKKYKYLHWSIFGTKAERADGSKPYRPEVGMKFVEQKVSYFLKHLSDDEKAVLQADIPQISSVLRSGDYPTFGVQIPVEMTGHEGVDPTFRVPFVDRKSIDDWGMGGSVKDPNGENYIFYILDLVDNKLPQSAVPTLSDKQVRSLYFMSETKAEDEEMNEPPPKQNKHFSSMAGMSYQDILDRAMGKK